MDHQQCRRVSRPFVDIVIAMPVDIQKMRFKRIFRGDARRAAALGQPGPCLLGRVDTVEGEDGALLGIPGIGPPHAGGCVPDS